MPATEPELDQTLAFAPHRNPVVLLAAMAVLLLALISFVALNIIHTSHQRIISSHLDTSLTAVTELLAYWERQGKGVVQVLADSSLGQDLFNRVLEEQGQRQQTRLELRRWLFPILLPMGYEGYFVLNLDRRIIDASSDSYLGQSPQFAETLEALDRALTEGTAISRPVASRLPLEGPQGMVPAGSLMQNLCVLIERKFVKKGFFCLRINPQKTFFPVFASGHSGDTGEVYAIDRSGRIITPTRFSELRNITSFAHYDQYTGAPLQARVPSRSGQQGELTIMARALLAQPLVNLNDPYLDYRGIRVVGTGRWLPQLDIGVIVEQDVQEAFAPFVLSRNIIIGLALSAMALIVVLTTSSILHRRNLAIREGRFRSLLVNIPTPVYLLSRAGQFTVANPAFSDMVRIRNDDLLGRSATELPVPHWLRPLLENPDAITEPLDTTLELRTPGDERKFYRIVRFPVRYHSGQLSQAMGTIIVDVSERMLAGEQLANANQNLERLVTERTVELVSAKEAAVAASRAKADFLANMSHEIRTPLNAIIGLSHVALASDLSDKVRNYLEKVRASGEHLLHVINDILDFSRLEVGKLNVDQVEFQLEQVLDNVVDLIWDRADAKGLELQVQIEPGIPHALIGDPLRLGQILINFTANAVKFTDQGHVCIRVRQLGAERDRVHLQFEVEDTGIGIEPELAATLFQPFHQVDSSSTRRFEGSGLGLAISKNLAALMHARIEVDSIPGQGSRFRLQIPFGRGQIASAVIALPGPAPALPAQATELATVHALLVEDNDINQELAVALVTACGARVDTVANGADAVAAVAQGHYDLVLMDIQMPVMDGIEATARIRQLPAGASLPIIAMTANALPGDREKFLAAGMNDYIAKPIDPDHLRAVLQRWGLATAREAAALVDPAAQFASLQQAGLDTKKALNQLMHNGALYQRLLTRFTEERAELPQQLTNALASGDQTQAVNLIHALKSLAGSLGMGELEQISAELEQQLREGSADDNLIERFEQQMRGAITLVRAWLNQQEGGD